MLLTIGETWRLPERSDCSMGRKERKELKAGTLTISSAMNQSGAGWRKDQLTIRWLWADGHSGDR